MGYIQLLEKKEKENEALRASALADAKRLSALLREKFDFDTLYLTGSLARGKVFTRQSDIDLVIRGLKTELFFKALGFLMSETSFCIDLKPYEELSETSRRLVESGGRVLQ